MIESRLHMGAKRRVPKMSRPRSFFYALRYFKSNKVVWFWALVLIMIVFGSSFAPVLAPYDPLVLSGVPLAPPSATHWMGTDEFGRDILSRVLYGGRISLRIGLLAVALAGCAGTTLGMLAGYFPRLENLIMRFIDGLMAFPSILLAILIMAVLGPSLTNLMIAVGISAIPWYARLANGITLAIKENLYIEAARAAGASSARVIARHIFPNLLAPILVLATLGTATAILAASALSFLGLGAKPPSPEWGAMLSSARTYMGVASWYAFFPGVAILLSVLSINVIGDALRDALDVRMRGT